MARIGVIPTKTSLQLREPDGDVGTIPAATSAAAGVMTAHHVQMLEEMYTRYQGGTASSPPVIIERAADTSHLASKNEVAALINAIPRPIDMMPALHALRGEITALQRDMTDNAQRLLGAPQAAGEIVDQAARHVLDNVLAGYENLETRLRAVESVIDSIRVLAELKGAEEAA